jgi:hypothetical protein
VRGGSPAVASVALGGLPTGLRLFGRSRPAPPALMGSSRRAAVYEEAAKPTTAKPRSATRDYLRGRAARGFAPCTPYRSDPVTLCVANEGDRSPLLRRPGDGRQGSRGADDVEFTHGRTVALAALSAKGSRVG